MSFSLQPYSYMALSGGKKQERLDAKDNRKKRDHEEEEKDVQFCFIIHNYLNI